ncbi:MAG TPA: hypothetical protein VJT71_06650 [Pyrinomonadaceae bacterium]|nr:hypothetical protein [Pyrinomonadaceae bacterium]
MRTISFILLAAAAWLVCGCGVPMESRVRADFRREHPDYRIISLDTGEGDGGAVYFHIRYTRPGDTAEHEDVWQYLNIGKGPWKLNDKSTVK